MKTERITVLHIIETLFEAGGTPRKLLSLVSNKRDQNIHYVFLVYNNHEKNLVDEIREAGCSVICVERESKFNILLLLDIVITVKRYEVDIINTHFARSDIFGTLIGFLLRLPVIKSVHGILWNEGGSSFNVMIDNWLNSYRFLTVCNSEASLRAENKRKDTANGRVVYNGVIPRLNKSHEYDTNNIREKLGIPPNSFVILTVGGLIRIRYQEVIISGTSFFQSKGKRVNCLIAGDGPQKKFLKQTADTLGVSDIVQLLGYVERVDELLAVADVYVSMAVDEGFGIAVVEAMLAGVPVVLANSGAHPELIVDNESGILVPPGDVDSLVNTLTSLNNNERLRERIGKAGKKRAESNFSISAFVENIEATYRECSSKIMT